jgi:hypothetical protein
MEKSGKVRGSLYLCAKCPIESTSRRIAAPEGGWKSEQSCVAPCFYFTRRVKLLCVQEAQPEESARFAGRPGVSELFRGR